MILLLECQIYSVAVSNRVNGRSQISPCLSLSLFPFHRVVSSMFVRIGQSFHAYFHYEIVKIHNPHCWIKSTGGRGLRTHNMISLVAGAGEGERGKIEGGTLTERGGEDERGEGERKGWRVTSWLERKRAGDSDQEVLDGK